MFFVNVEPILQNCKFILCIYRKMRYEKAIRNGDRENKQEHQKQIACALSLGVTANSGHGHGEPARTTTQGSQSRRWTLSK